MKERLLNISKLILMATVIVAIPVCAFAASSKNGSHVKEILFVGIAIAFVIDMVHESKRGRRK